MENNKQPETFKVRPEENHLYDKYAGEAMTSLLRIVADGVNKLGFEMNDDLNIVLNQAVAEGAFNTAEAMILERRKRR